MKIIGSIMLFVCSSLYAMNGPEVKAQEFCLRDIASECMEIYHEVKKSNKDRLAAFSEHPYTQKFLAQTMQCLKVTKKLEETHQLVTKGIALGSVLLCYTILVRLFSSFSSQEDVKKEAIVSSPNQATTNVVHGHENGGKSVTVNVYTT